MNKTHRRRKHTQKEIIKMGVIIHKKRTTEIHSYYLLSRALILTL